MKALRRMLFIVLVVILFSITAGAEYVGSHPDEGVFVSQTQKHTCTLIAATMMLRNYAYQKNSVYEMIDEDIVRMYGWTQTGLLWDFSIGSTSISVSHDIRSVQNKKQYLINALMEHPEGIVIYDANLPHAIFLFGYDTATDTFYCADTTTDRANRAIRLEESILKGKTQEDKIRGIDRIWYVIPHQAA